MGSRIDENAHAPSAPALDSSDVNVPVDGPSRALAPASPDAADVRRSGSAHVLTHVLTSPTRSVPSGDGAGTASLWPRLSPDERPLSPLNPKSDRGRATKAPAVVEAPVDDDKRESKHVSKPFTPTQCLLGISFLSLCWMLVTAFALAPLGANSGPTGAACVGTPTEGTLCLCPRPTVCATEWHEVVFLAFARASAYFDYPMYMLLFLTKCHNLCGAAYRTYLKEWLPLDDAHHLHTFAGTFVACEVVWHSSWHVARWACGGDLRFLWEHRTGVTGAVALLVTPLIAVPMMFEKARKRVPYEYRKTMHYLSVVWGIAVAFHAPATNVFWVVGVCVCLYLGDWLVGYFLCIRYCPTLKMTRLGETAVEVVFQHPKGFVNHGGNYVYLCLPWLGKAEWHAFSLYAHPTLENHSSVCVAKLGDWTGALHRALSKPSAKPRWVYGPFPSPFSAATDSDNLVSVASGIGVTPTLGTIKLLSSSRTVNVVWMCRDADLVEYFLRTVTFDLDAWSLIYYTGKRKLVLSEDQFRANPKLLLIQGRPDIRRVVLDIVRACETDGELNRDTVDAAHAMHLDTFHCGSVEKFKRLLEKMLVTYSMHELFVIAVRFTLNHAHTHGKPVGEEDGHGHCPVHRVLSLSAADGVTLPGFAAFVDQIGDVPGLLNQTQVANVFAQLDSSSDGVLDEDEFALAMQTLSGLGGVDRVESDSGRGGREHAELQFDRRKTFNEKLNSVGSGKGDGGIADFSNWQILYCGGAAPVVKTLLEMRNDLRVGVQIESFDW